ncbi:Cation efflux family protein [Clostridium vincentii]|uniref:Cation efflux family protein n=1 Tax=Clostridium vincentii TaxID=52704 RepID=A0A2T0BCV9_9CLOT|nr:Cation efflux family protein [Clostridium vincentii]
MKASGADASYDVIMSAVTLISEIIFKFAGISIDGYVGILIDLFIIYSGIQMMRETISSILGERADKELVQSIKGEIIEHKPISGVYLA